MSVSTHVDQIRYLELPEPVEGCAECLAGGDWWVYLRMCQSCGQIGSCDSSPNRHASHHARTERASDRPVGRTGATSGARATWTRSRSWSTPREVS